MMVKAASIVAVLVVLAIATVLGIAATRPNTFRVERSAAIQAPPEKIYPLITDLRGWSAWSPYEKRDPAMKRAFSGAPSGQGAVYEWDGNSQVGAGRMEITEVAPPSKVRIQLDFVRPMKGNNVAVFAIAPLDTGTQVTWSMAGPMPFVSKVISVFIDMDTMIGRDFEAGLAALKAVAEK